MRNHPPSRVHRHYSRVIDYAGDSRERIVRALVYSRLQTLMRTKRAVFYIIAAKITRVICRVLAISDLY